MINIIIMISEDHVTLETEVMMLKISFDHRNKLHFNIYLNRNVLNEKVSNSAVFTVFDQILDNQKIL